MKSNRPASVWRRSQCPLCLRPKPLRIRYHYCADCRWSIERKAQAILDGDACLEDMRKGPVRDEVARVARRISMGD